MSLRLLDLPLRQLVEFLVEHRRLSRAELFSRPDHLVLVLVGNLVEIPHYHYAAAEIAPLEVDTKQVRPDLECHQYQLCQVIRLHSNHNLNHNQEKERHILNHNLNLVL